MFRRTGGYQPKGGGGPPPKPPSGGSAASYDREDMGNQTVADVMLAKHNAEVQRALNNKRVAKALAELDAEGVSPFIAQSCLRLIRRGV